MVASSSIDAKVTGFKSTTGEVKVAVIELVETEVELVSDKN